MGPLKRISSLLLLALDGLIASFFALIILITISQVILRYVFNSSIIGGNEAMEALFIYTTAIGSAAAVRRRQHISITVAAHYLPQVLKRIADVAVHLLIGFLNGAMIYYSTVWISKVGGNESPVLRIPEWIFQISIPIGCSLVIIYCLINIVLVIGDPESLEEGEPC